ncbi:MAG: hypothetical protein C0518_03315 [Opitutus sp.]|nr:hypothetical protein [Opitutus sp.]
MPGVALGEITAASAATHGAGAADRELKLAEWGAARLRGSPSRRAVLSIQTRKSLRKWRDRCFMMRERALDRWLFPRGKRIAFWPWKELEEPVRRSFAFTRHRISFTPLLSGGGDFDLVVPLSIETLHAAAADDSLRRRNPLPIPTRQAIELCDDKAALNARLRDLGYRRHVPADAGQSVYPRILKLRRDSAARNIFRLDGPADEVAHRLELDSPDWLQQACVPGEVEYTAHVLQIDGRLRRAITLSFCMAHDRAIKGRDHVVIHRRCANRHLALFEEMLNAIGFEGLCCFNYKEREGVPVIFEINPRFGFTLGPFFAAFVRSLAWERAERVATVARRGRGPV